MDEQGEYRKYRKQIGPGKGDVRRPTNEEIFRDNYDAINWHRKKRKSGSSVEPPDIFHVITGR